jgi:HemY protein
VIRGLLIFIGLALGAAAAAWLADRPGDVVVDWQGWRIETSVAAATVGLAVLALAAATLYSGWLWLRRGPELYGRVRAESRRARGQAALEQGFVALAAGEKAAARKLAARALGLLGETSMALLLAAQSAEAAGETEEATRLFDRLRARPDGAFLGVRGLLVRALRTGDSAAALRLAREALALRPESPWLQTLMFDLQSAAGLWHEAQATLEDASRRHVVDRATARRRQAIARLGEAQVADRAGDAATAARLAREAQGLAPGLAPAALLAARHAHAAGNSGHAARIIETCWKTAPTAPLAARYMSLWTGDDAARRVRRAERLERHNRGHRESHVVLADALLSARRWRDARRHLETVLADRPERRLLRLMATLEEGERGAGSGRDWMVRAEAGDAPPDDGWYCSGCGTAVAAWAPHCPACGRFDSLAFGAPLAVRSQGALVLHGGLAGQAASGDDVTDGRIAVAGSSAPAVPLATLARLGESVPDLASGPAAAGPIASGVDGSRPPS